jgi:hypothetical protein
MSKGVLACKSCKQSKPKTGFNRGQQVRAEKGEKPTCQSCVRAAKKVKKPKK